MKKLKETDNLRDCLLNNIYTPLLEAKKELERRRGDKKLLKKVFDFLGKHPLQEVGEETFAFQSKSIFSPNRELKNFLDLSSSVGLKPMLLEYNGKFVARNFEKYLLCKMYFNSGVNKKGETICVSKRIIDFNKEEGNNMGIISTISGSKLKDLHHELLFREYPDIKNNLRDLNDWFDKSVEMDEQIYTYFLSLFLVNGILFENYLPDDAEEKYFIKNKLIPGIKRVEKIFGVKPLIVPSLPFEGEDLREWYSYDNQTFNHFNDIINKN